MGRAGGQYGVSFLIGPRPVGVGGILPAPDVLNASGGIRSQIAAFRSPTEQSRKSGLYVIGEFAALVLRGLVADTDDEGLVEFNQWRVSDRF